MVGRSAESDVCLTAGGVWDRHLTLSLTPELELVVTVEDGALASFNGVPASTHRIRNGDRITVGVANIEVTLAPVVRRALSTWEVFLGFLFAAVVGAQAYLGWWLYSRP